MKTLLFSYGCMLRGLNFGYLSIFIVLKRSVRPRVRTSIFHLQFADIVSIHEKVSPYTISLLVETIQVGLIITWLYLYFGRPGCSINESNVDLSK